MFDWVPEEVNITDYDVLSRHNDMTSSTPQFYRDACGNHPNRMTVSCVEDNAIRNKGTRTEKYTVWFSRVWHRAVAFGILTC
jgi:hypothetical protein